MPSSGNQPQLCGMVDDDDDDSPSRLVCVGAGQGCAFMVAGYFWSECNDNGDWCARCSAVHDYALVTHDYIRDNVERLFVGAEDSSSEIRDIRDETFGGDERHRVDTEDLIRSARRGWQSRARRWLSNYDPGRYARAWYIREDVHFRNVRLIPSVAAKSPGDADFKAVPALKCVCCIYAKEAMRELRAQVERVGLLLSGGDAAAEIDMLIRVQSEVWYLFDRSAGRHTTTSRGERKRCRHRWSASALCIGGSGNNNNNNNGDATTTGADAVNWKECKSGNSPVIAAIHRLCVDNAIHSSCGVALSMQACVLRWYQRLVVFGQHWQQPEKSRSTEDMDTIMVLRLGLPHNLQFGQHIDQLFDRIMTSNVSERCVVAAILLRRMRRKMDAAKVLLRDSTSIDVLLNMAPEFSMWSDFCAGGLDELRRRNHQDLPKTGPRKWVVPRRGSSSSSNSRDTAKNGRGRLGHVSVFRPLAELLWPETRIRDASVDFESGLTESLLLCALQALAEVVVLAIAGAIQHSTQSEAVWREWQDVVLGEDWLVCKDETDVTKRLPVSSQLIALHCELFPQNLADRVSMMCCSARCMADMVLCSANKKAIADLRWPGWDARELELEKAMVDQACKLIFTSDSARSAVGLSHTRLREAQSTARNVTMGRWSGDSDFPLLSSSRGAGSGGGHSGLQQQSVTAMALLKVFTYVDHVIHREKARRSAATAATAAVGGVIDAVEGLAGLLPVRAIRIVCEMLSPPESQLLPLTLSDVHAKMWMLLSYHADGVVGKTAYSRILRYFRDRNPRYIFRLWHVCRAISHIRNSFALKMPPIVHQVQVAAVEKDIPIRKLCVVCPKCDNVLSLVSRHAGMLDPSHRGKPVPESRACDYNRDRASGMDRVRFCIVTGKKTCAFGKIECGTEVHCSDMRGRLIAFRGRCFSLCCGKLNNDNNSGGGGDQMHRLHEYCGQPMEICPRQSGFSSLGPLCVSCTARGGVYYGQSSGAKQRQKQKQRRAKRKPPATQPRNRRRKISKR